jgi:hypothetical protein
MDEAAIFERDLTLPPAEVLAAIGRAADLWGADWHSGTAGGQLVLPVARGLRRGVSVVGVQLESSTVGSHLLLRVERTETHLNRPAVAVLSLGALGGLITVLWPFFPNLMRLAPLGAVLALVAWLLVVSRLRSSDAEAFVELIAELTERT